MDESKNEKPKEERRLDPELLKKGLHCDLDQYEMLKRCSDKKDMTEWNEWRTKKENRHKDIELEGASLGECYLKEVYLHQRGGYFLNDDGTNDNSKKVCSNVHLKGAHFNHSNIKYARLMNADLQGVRFRFAHLEGADISEANLIGAKCQRAKVNGSTSFWECKVNRYCKNNEFTDFSGVALDDTSIDPGTKQLLEYNIRRKNWEEWYKKHCFWRWPIRLFWLISDYGLSAPRVMGVFFLLAVVFAAVYYAWGFIDYYFVGIRDYPGIVSDLFVLEDKQETVSCWLVPFRAVYFSIVTMTTLGFGDMYANAHNFLRGLLGHVLLAFQVILGYVLLGALITRFAVLFTAGGPAGEFAKEK